MSKSKRRRKLSCNNTKPTTQALTTTDKKTTAPKKPPRDTSAASKPVLRFTPYVWSKILHMRNIADTEVAGFGISYDDDPLLISDFALVKQKASKASFDFDDIGLGNFNTDMMLKGLSADHFFRVWIHTHPGGPTPSSVDYGTLNECFKSAPWTVMFIVGTDNKYTAKLRLQTPTKCEIDIQMKIDYNTRYPGTDEEAWEAELKEKVTKETLTYTGTRVYRSGTDLYDEYDDPHWWLDRYQYGNQHMQSWADQQKPIHTQHTLPLKDKAKWHQNSDGSWSKKETAKFNKHTMRSLEAITKHKLTFRDEKSSSSDVVMLVEEEALGALLEKDKKLKDFFYTQNCFRYPLAMELETLDENSAASLCTALKIGDIKRYDALPLWDMDPEVLLIVEEKPKA